MSLSPTVAVLAGINGAGKTTASQRVFRAGGLRVPIFVNADTIARGLNALDVDSMAAKAGRIMLDHLYELAAERKSFAFETTLAARTYAPWLGKLKDSGTSSTCSTTGCGVRTWLSSGWPIGSGPAGTASPSRPSGGGTAGA